MTTPGSLSRHTPLAERFRTLGDVGLFAALSDPERIVGAARRLSRLAYEADELGWFLSLISAAGLGVPILARHVPEPASALGCLLADAIGGRAVLAVGITERTAGSDVSSMRTTVTRDANGVLRLNGSKWHVTNAPIAGALIVFAIDATTDDRFMTTVVVKPDDPGVRCGPPLDLIGCKGSPTGEIFLENVPLATERIVGRAEDGRGLLELAFVRERVLAPWPLLGKMERVLEECLDHIEAREQFGKPLHEFQYVQEKIVSSFEQLIHARHLAERAVGSVAAGKPEAAIASLAKATAADAAAHTFRAAIEIFGSYGVQSDRLYGDFLNDAICAQIAGGTRETHKKVVFGELRLERARARRGRPCRLLRDESGDGADE